jgi:hypothetical protein
MWAVWVVGVWTRHFDSWQAICAASNTRAHTAASAAEGIMKRLLVGLAVIAALSTGGSAFSADVLLRAYAAHQGAHGQREFGATPRPPSAIPDLTNRPSNVAVSALNVRDSHVLEFLRWKEQLRRP